MTKEEAFQENGSTTVETAASMEYNGYNQLSRAINPEGEIADYTYNADGLRVRKEYSGQVTNYYYEAGEIVLELGADNELLAKNLHGRNILFRETGDKTYSYITNIHGDVRKLTDELGNMVIDYDFDPFGNAVGKEENLFGINATIAQWQQEIESVDNPFRYCGEYLDAETGLYYLRARYYDPESGRFTQEDPVKDGPNWYVYCANNPIMFIDPSGKKEAEDDKVLDAADLQAIRVLTGKYYEYESLGMDEEKEAVRREAVAIRQQEKYAGKYSNSDESGTYKDDFGYQYANNGFSVEVVVMSEGMAWLYGGKNDKNDWILRKYCISIPVKIGDVMWLASTSTNLDQYNRALKNLREGDTKFNLKGFSTINGEFYSDESYYRFGRRRPIKITQKTKIGLNRQITSTYVNPNYAVNFTDTIDIVSLLFNHLIDGYLKILLN